MSPRGWLGSATTAAATAVGLCVYAVVHLVPRRDSLWVFGADGGERFSGNPKYLFLHVAAEHDDDVRPVWLSTEDRVVADLTDAGFEAYRRDSVRGRYVTARAGCIFTSHGAADVAKWYTGGAEDVQLWHGVPLKKIGRHVDRAWSPAGRFFFWLFCSHWDHLVVTSENQADIFADAYPVDSEDVAALGYPRNDALSREFPGETPSENAPATGSSPSGARDRSSPTFRRGDGDSVSATAARSPP